MVSQPVVIPRRDLLINPPYTFNSCITSKGIFPVFPSVFVLGQGGYNTYTYIYIYTLPPTNMTPVERYLED